MAFFTFGVELSLADENHWNVLVHDEYSGIEVLGPSKAAKLSLSDVTAYWTTRDCKIGGDIRLSTKSYRNLNSIYIGGWYQSHSIGNAQAHAHLLAIPAEGLSINAKTLLENIRKVVGYSTIESTYIADSESPEVLFFEDSHGINGHGSTVYAALQIQKFIYLAVLSSRDGAPLPEHFLKISKPSTSLIAPYGDPMSPHARSIVSADKARSVASEKKELVNDSRKEYNRFLDWDWWSQALISFVVIVAILFFAKKFM